jgi:hypothetical protein
MSTTYTAFRAAVKAAIVAASGLDAAAVVWTERGETVADPLVVLDVISDVRTVPVRDVLVTDGGDGYTRTRSTMRDVAVQIRVDSLRGDSLGLANDIELKLGFDVPRALLEAECVVVDAGPMRDLKYRHQDLRIQARAFELFLRLVLEATDPTPVGTIGTVKVQGTPIDLPPPVSLTEDTISEDDS